MSREIRMVPTNWQHPKQYKYDLLRREEKIIYRPLHDGGLEGYKEQVEEWKKELEEWVEGWKLWETGFYKTYEGEIVPIAEVIGDMLTSWCCDPAGDLSKYHDEEMVALENGDFSYETYEGEPPSPPNPYDYMPEGDWIQLFEGVSEGTPLSPPFATKEELIDWLNDNKDFCGDQWTREQAEAIVKDKYAPSMVMRNGKVYNSRESLLLDKEDSPS